MSLNNPKSLNAVSSFNVLKLSASANWCKKFCGYTFLLAEVVGAYIFEYHSCKTLKYLFLSASGKIGKTSSLKHFSASIRFTPVPFRNNSIMDNIHWAYGRSKIPPSPDVFTGIFNSLIALTNWTSLFSPLWERMPLIRTAKSLYVRPLLFFSVPSGLYSI